MICVFLFLIGCVYETPITKKHEIKIDSTALGLWQIKTTKNDDKERMLILKFSDTEYLIHYPINHEDMYFRAYPFKIKKQQYIQLQMIGNKNGPLRKDENNTLFSIALYQQNGDELEVRMIKTKFMNANKQSNGEFNNAKELLKAIEASKNIKEFFGEPEIFERVKEK